MKHCKYTGPDAVPAITPGTSAGALPVLSLSSVLTTFLCFVTWWFAWKERAKDAVVRESEQLLTDESGEVNIVAMVLIIIVVIALVAIFRSEMTDIVTKMFEKIRSGMDL